MDEVYSVPSYKGAPRGRRRGWPEARPRPSLRLLDGSLQGPPRFAVGLIQSSHRGFVLPLPTARSGVSAASTDARLAETSDPLEPPVHRAGTAQGPGPRHIRIANRTQVAPQPGRSRLRVLVGRRFFRPGDGCSGRRHEVLVAMGCRLPRESSSPSRWASWFAHNERRVAHRTPNRHLHQNVEVVQEGLASVFGDTPHSETQQEAAGLAHVTSTMDSTRHATHVLVDSRFISRRLSAAAQSCTSRPLPLVLREYYCWVSIEVPEYRWRTGA